MGKENYPLSREKSMFLMDAVKSLDYESLNTESCHNANLVATGGTAGGQNYTIWHHHNRQMLASWQLSAFGDFRNACDHGQSQSQWIIISSVLCMGVRPPASIHPNHFEIIVCCPYPIRLLGCQHQATSNIGPPCDVTVLWVNAKQFRTFSGNFIAKVHHVYWKVSGILWATALGIERKRHEPAFFALPHIHGSTFRETSGPFYWHGLTLILAWISNYIHYKVWNEIIYPFLNLNGATVEV